MYGRFSYCSSVVYVWVVYMFFCGNCSTWDVPTWRHFACSLKKVNVGYCGKLFEVRESGQADVSERVKRGSTVLENEVNTADIKNLNTNKNFELVRGTGEFGEKKLRTCLRCICFYLTKYLLCSTWYIPVWSRNKMNQSTFPLKHILSSCNEQQKPSSY